MLYRITWFALAVLLLAGCQPQEKPAETVQAEQTNAAPTTLFAQIDTDADGVLSNREHVAHSEAWFAKCDANADGALDGKEQQMWLESVFDTVCGDTDDDSDDEMDGEDEDELEDDDSFTVDQMLAFALGDCADIEPVYPQVKTPRYVFFHIDCNGDREIDKAEQKGFILARFDMLDQNHDGKVTEDEFFALRKQELAALDIELNGSISRGEMLNSRYGAL